MDTDSNTQYVFTAGSEIVSFMQLYVQQWDLLSPLQPPQKEAHVRNPQSQQKQLFWIPQVGFNSVLIPKDWYGFSNIDQLQLLDSKSCSIKNKINFWNPKVATFGFQKFVSKNDCNFWIPKVCPQKKIATFGFQQLQLLDSKGWPPKLATTFGFQKFVPKHNINFWTLDSKSWSYYNVWFP